MARAAAKKKGASRNSRSPGGGKSVPGWLWLMLGLAMGVFVAFLWHLWELRQDNMHKRVDVTQTGAAAPEKSKPESANTTASSSAPANKYPAGEPRFDFYTLLPSQQIMPGKHPAPSPQPAGKPAGDATSYTLQAGSFKSEAEADKRRASILMLGLPVKVMKVPVKPGETWYRVVVGPFPGKAEVQSARANLRSNGVDTMVLKQS